jgi:hypothetical protein
MATDQAASGPDAGNAGEAKMTLGAAITAVLDGADKGAGDASPPPADISDEMTNPEVAKLAGKGKNTGDDREAEDAAAAADQTKDTKGEAADPAKDGDAKTLEAPKHWPAADKEAFGKLPKDGQETILKLAKNLEGGFTRKSQELSDKAKFADAIRGLFDEPTRAQLRSVGFDEAGAIRYLIESQRFATQDGPGYIKWAMQRTGVTPEQLGFAPQTQADGKTPHAGQPDPQTGSTGDPKLDELLADPAVKQLRTELAEAKQMLAKQQELLGDVAGRMTARERAEFEYVQGQQRQQTQGLQSLIGEFRSQLDDSGQLAFPHFDQVYRQMGAIMDTDPKLRAMPDGVDKMAAAYRKVVGGDPELSQPLIEAEVAKRLAAAQKKADAERAKRVAAVKPASGSPTQKTRVSSMDDAISAAFAKQGF